MVSSKKNLEVIVNEIYKQLYLNSTPKADWEELKSSSPKSELGIEIPYNNYSIDKELMDSIIQKYTKGLSTHNKNRIKITIYLGCSPRFKEKEYVG